MEFQFDCNDVHGVARATYGIGLRKLDGVHGVSEIITFVV